MERNVVSKQSTVFNKAQLHLLEMFSRVKSEEELWEIRDLLADFYAKKVDVGIAELEAKGLWGREQSEAVMREHLRTPYHISSKTNKNENRS